MNTFRTMTAAAVILASALAPHITLAQSPGVTRNDLQRHDLSIPGREAIQTIVSIAPGVTAPGTRIRAKRSSMCSKACWSISSTDPPR